MNKSLYLLPFALFSIGIAYGEPLDDMKTSILNDDGNSAEIQLTWNNDQKVSKYEVGCVSCIPNIVQTTQDSSISLSNITSLPEGSLAVLYAIAYDFENEIIAAKQIIIDLKTES